MVRALAGHSSQQASSALSGLHVGSPTVLWLRLALIRAIQQSLVIV